MPTAKPTPGKLLPPLPPAIPDWSPVRTYRRIPARSKNTLSRGPAVAAPPADPRTCPCMDVECRPRTIKRPRLLVLGGVT